jgi:C1A family cysteine protease
MLKATVLFYVVLCLTFAVHSAAKLSKAQIDSSFESFKKKFNKSYENPTVEAYRKNIFVNNLEFILDVNEHAETFVTGVTKFTDNTQAEIKRNLLTYREEDEPQTDGVTYTSLMQTRKLKLKTTTRQLNCTLVNESAFPAIVDYRDSGILSPIRDQGWCGCCWAFASVFQIEYYFAKRTGQMRDFSVQQLVDCNTGNFACDGGTLTKAMGWHVNWPTTDAVNYPYIDGKSTCKYPTTSDVETPAVNRLMTTVTLLRKPLEDVINALIKFGPLITTMDSTYLPFYVSGIFDPAPFEYDCTTANHAVNIIGYGIDPETKRTYFIVRNSWGELWGEQGNFRIWTCVCMIGNRVMYGTPRTS